MFNPDHTHVKVMCSCGRVISQCRCISRIKKTIETRKSECQKCQEKKAKEKLEV